MHIDSLKSWHNNCSELHLILSNEKQTRSLRYSFEFYKNVRWIWEGQFRDKLPEKCSCTRRNDENLWQHFNFPEIEPEQDHLNNTVPDF